MPQYQHGTLSKYTGRSGILPLSKSQSKCDNLDGTKNPYPIRLTALEVVVGDTTTEKYTGLLPADRCAMYKDGDRRKVC